jgi:hypothetical protein
VTGNFSKPMLAKLAKLALVPGQGWRQLAEGIYQDPDGLMHISMPEVMKHLNIADTPQNREDTSAVIGRIVKQLLPDAHLDFEE